MAHFFYGRTVTPILLLSRLASLNPRFDVSAHLEKFQSSSTNLDKVNFVYKDLRKYKLFPKFVKLGKSDADSEMRRKAGNDAFGRGDYLEALKIYTSSISNAKRKGVLALAYANRSACLYKLGRYQECLTDIERAILNNYPEILKPKLIQRRKHAEVRLASVKSAKSYHEDTPQFEDFEKHPRIQCAKNCVEIKTNKEFGRHVVATRDIKIGEIICVENPYATTLIDHRAMHCHMCLELCYNTIPCDNCCFLLFCSEECKNRANNTFHKYECPIIATLLANGVTDSEIVALRVAILARESYCQLNSSNLNVNEQEMYRSDRYKEIHNLMPATEKYKAEDLFQLTVVASLMCHFLENHTDFFNNENTKRNFKEVVLLQLQIVNLNELIIHENTKTFFTCEPESFALGLYAFGSLFNHSCCPNIEQIQYGSTMVSRTLNTIKKGQQCFVSYGFTYGNTPKMVRQRCLRESYLFDCRCEACKKNWDPSDDLIPFKFPLFMDLCMTRSEVMTMEIQLSSNDVDVAKHYLPRLIRQLQRLENFEPWGNALKIKRLIAKCYHIFGNKKLL